MANSGDHNTYFRQTKIHLLDKCILLRPRLLQESEMQPIMLVLVLEFQIVDGWTRSYQLSYLVILQFVINRRVLDWVNDLGLLDLGAAFFDFAFQNDIDERALFSLFEDMLISCGLYLFSFSQ